jgi:hypothetical protein
MIIAISGKKGSGKDTVGNMLYYILNKANDEFIKNPKQFDNSYIKAIESIEWDDNYINRISVKPIFIIKSFAKYLKEICATVLNCNVFDFENRKFKEAVSGFKIYQFGNEKYLTNREVLLYFGKLLRNDNEDIFVDKILDEYNYCNKNFIITDLRFQNEYFKLIRKSNIILIRINAKNKGLESINDANNMHDKSEIDLDNVNGWDIELDYQHNLKDLFKNLKSKILLVFKDRGVNIKC